MKVEQDPLYIQGTREERALAPAVNAIVTRIRIAASMETGRVPTRAAWRILEFSSAALAHQVQFNGAESSFELFAQDFEAWGMLASDFEDNRFDGIRRRIALECPLRHVVAFGILDGFWYL